MTDRVREILGAQLVEIDRRRAELECMLASLPPANPHSCCCDCHRQDLEDELRDLWRARVALAEQIRPPRRAACEAGEIG
jgi:hypothetical protein